MRTTDHILYRPAGLGAGPARLGAGPARLGAGSTGTETGGFATGLMASSISIIASLLGKLASGVMKAITNLKFVKPARRLPVLLLLLALLTGTTALAQDFTDKRSVTRSYPASRETTLEVQNKYGKIQLATWERDSVDVSVDLFLTESSSSKLRKLKDDIHIDFTGTNTYILVKTVIESESGRLASELRSVTHTITGSNKRVEVNYMIHVPKYMDVVLQNKFGDIFLDELDGQVDIDLSNGVLKANRLEGNCAISLSFANGMINALGSATMDLSYTDLTLGEANQLDVESKSSEVRIEKANVVKINSRRDKYHLQKVEYFYGNSDFTQVWVFDFIRESDLYMKYGELTIEHILPGFNRIYVESDYTDISLWFDPASSFSFDILHHEKSVLRLPGEGVTADERYDGKSHFQTTGSAGQGETAGRLQIDALQKCYVNISFK